MRRSTFLVRSGALAASAVLAGCGASTPVDRFTKGLATLPRFQIVALGDSLALGTGASSPENGFIFRAYLRLRERYPYSRLDDLAIGGATAGDVLRLEVPRLAHEETANVAILCVGGNDVLHRTPPDAFAATYARLVAAVRSRIPAARLVLCGVPDVGLSPLFSGRDQETAARLARTYDASVRAIARREGLAFADLYGATRSHRGEIGRLLSDDRFHPSDAGHAVFADALAPVLLRVAGGSARAVGFR